MKNISIFLSKDEQTLAYNTMLEKQLLFLPDEPESQKKLCDFLQEHRNLPNFIYQNTTYDQNLVIAATPNLGSNQLGVYAMKSFVKGDIVGEIKGTNLFGVLPTSKIEHLLKEYKGNSSYIWQLDLEEGQEDEHSVVIDLLESGTSTRWINHTNTPNVEVKITCKRRKDENGTILFDYHAYYVACKNINFADELSISYGREYFTKLRPQILRNSSNLIKILYDLANIQNPEFSIIGRINTRTDIKEFFHSLIKRQDMWRKQEQPASTRTEEFKYAYLNTRLEPKIYDLHNPEDVSRFQKNQKIKLQGNSSYHLYIAPTVRKNGEHRHSLFTVEKIPKGKVVCKLIGEEKQNVPKTNKQMGLWAKINKIDLNYLVESGKGGFIYTKELASEAYCIEGTTSKKQMNVSFDFKTNSYVTTREIKPGEEIVTFYEDYNYSAPPTTLDKVINAFNEAQYYYTAHWSNGKVTMEDRLPKTPGYGLDEIDEELEEPSSQNVESPDLTPDDFYESIRTPGHDITPPQTPDPMEQTEELSLSASFLEDTAKLLVDGHSRALTPDPMQIEQKENSTTQRWSPTFQFSPQPNSHMPSENINPNAFKLGS